MKIKNKPTIKKSEPESVISRIDDSKKKTKINPIFIISIVSLIFGLGIFIYTKKIYLGLITVASVFAAIELFIFFRKKLEESAKLRKMEEVFPDFIELMASNLRAGMTVDRALLVSSRKEFSPLDVEILKLGKDILTGKEITSALKAMGERIKSEKIKKTIDLINSGMKAGGNLSILLEETAVNMREKMFMEKRAADRKSVV